MASTSVDSILKGYDEIQAKLMDEECILINEDDVKVGEASKKVCHLWTNIEKGRYCVFVVYSCTSLWNGLLCSLNQELEPSYFKRQELELSFSKCY